MAAAGGNGGSDIRGRRTTVVEGFVIGKGGNRICHSTERWSLVSMGADHGVFKGNFSQPADMYHQRLDFVIKTIFVTVEVFSFV